MCSKIAHKKGAGRILTLTHEELLGLQAKSLEILLYFKEFCEKYGLTFYLCGGCCIGAIRHKGFIPWDDDVDVFMPREDYEKLFKLWDKYADTSRYSCNRTTKNKFFGNIMTTITDNHTSVIRPWQKKAEGHKGVMMDVLPIDGCAPKGIKRKMQKLYSMIFSLYCSRFVPEKHGKFMAFACRILLGAVPENNLKNKIWMFAEKQMSKYKIKDCTHITELCSGPGYMQNEYPKKLFEKPVYKEFEGYLMPLPAGYDEYLKMAFGNYMMLPAKEKQVPHHDIIYINLNSER